MSKVDFKLNRSGVRELLKSQEMQAMLNEKASGIRNRCGVGYSNDVRAGKNRAIAMVKADTPEARNDNSENNTILKAVK